jgi:hypothetical protein
MLLWGKVTQPLIQGKKIPPSSKRGKLRTALKAQNITHCSFRYDRLHTTTKAAFHTS